MDFQEFDINQYLIELDEMEKQTNKELEVVKQLQEQKDKLISQIEK